MNYCRKCGNVLKEGQRFCSKCGEDISPASKENGMRKETDGLEKKPRSRLKAKEEVERLRKKIKRTVIISVSVLGVIGIVITAVALWFNYSKKNGNKILKELKAGNYEEAIDYFRDNYDEVSDELIENLKERLKEIEASYLAGETSYENASAEINAIAKLKIKQTEASIEEISALIEEINASRTAFEKANSYFTEGRYPEAMILYLKVSEKDANYAAANTQLIEAGKNKAAAEAAEGKYLEAIATLKELLEYADESAELNEKVTAYTDAYVNGVITEAEAKLEEKDFSGSRQLINSALTNLDSDNVTLEAYLENIEKQENTYNQQEVSKVLAEAREYAAKEDYASAIAALSAALNKFPGNEEIAAAQTEYKLAKQTAEIEAAISKADSYADEKAYDEALSVLEAAMQNYPENEALRTKHTEVEEKKPVPLTSFTFADSKNAAICEDNVRDTLGNEYWGGDNIKIGRSYWSEEGFLTIYLGGKYSKITGTIACGEATRSGKEADLGFYGDSERLYKLHISRTMAPTKVSVDVSGVDWLEICLESAQDLYALLLDFQVEK